MWKDKDAVLWLTKQSFSSSKPQFPQLKMEYSSGETSWLPSYVGLLFPNFLPLARSDRVLEKKIDSGFKPPFPEVSNMTHFSSYSSNSPGVGFERVFTEAFWP